MTLDDRAVLELTVNGRTGSFHLLSPESRAEHDTEFILDGRGQSIREAADIVASFGEDDDPDPEAVPAENDPYFVGSGASQDTINLSFKAGFDAEAYNANDIAFEWGDGSGGPSRWDAPEAPPLTQLQVLDWWVRNAPSDSFRGRGSLHWGEWTDGSIDGEAGIFGEPVGVVIRSFSVERSRNGPSEFEGTFEFQRAASITELTEDDENNPLNGLLNR